MPIGPLMIDIAGTHLTDEDKSIIANPLVGGVILFTRNFQDIEQLTKLCYSIRECKKTPLLIAVDHEGGRVQRFQTGFTRIPAMGELGEYYDREPAEALQLTQALGWLMAIELLTVGIDFSFAPVLDLNNPVSTIIADRAFHADPELVAMLARSFIQGMNKAGMQAIGKHYPGHGSIAPDSHISLPIDERSPDEILNQDMVPFLRLVREIAGVMPAHIVYQCLDELPAGFSTFWLDTVLRKQAGFTGAIISDDLSMVGAHAIGDIVTRVGKALSAGCDMVLICNDRKAVHEVLNNFTYQEQPLSKQRLLKLCGHFQHTRTELGLMPEWHLVAEKLLRFKETIH